MRKIVFIILFTVLLFECIYPVHEIDRTKDFKLSEQWRHEDGPFGRYVLSLINSEGEIVANFQKGITRLINPNKAVAFAPYGQGPGDLTNAMAGFLYNGNLAIVETATKIKIFKKKEGNYVWDETKWLKMGYYPQLIRGGIFREKKFFLTGIALQKDEKSNNSMATVALVTVYDEDGNYIKPLVLRRLKGIEYFHEMTYWLAGYKDTVIFLQENKLEAIVISSKRLEVEKTFQLEKPPFYTEMPKDYYLRAMQREAYDVIIRKLEKWAVSYSGIRKVVVDGSYLVLQIRTCKKDMKKFALLFYNIEKNFKLEKTIMIDDLLLGALNGKFYFYANGNPGFDDDTEDLIINIYQMRK